MRSVWRYVLNLPAPRGGSPPFQSSFPRVVPPVICRILPLFALRHDWSPLYAIFLDALVTGPATSVVPSRGGHSGSGYASHRAAAHRFFSFFVPLVRTMWIHARVMVPRDSRAVLASLPSWPLAIMALHSGGGSGHISSPEPRWALGFRIREPPGYRPSITFFHIGEYHVPSRTGGGPPCLPCRSGFPAVLAFHRIGLTT